MYQHFVNQYNQIFPFDDGIKDAIQRFVTSGGDAVDLGCATGRLVHLLHDLGMHAIGIDLEPLMINRAKRDFPNHLFYQASMVDYLDDTKQYDLITCFGNTLPHLDHDQLLLFMNRIKKTLRDNGFFLVTLLNYEQILKNKPSQLKRIENDQFTFERYYDYQQDHILFKTVMTMQGLKSEGTTKLFAYTKDDLSHMLDRIGLKYTFYKNLNQDPYDSSSSHLTVVITH